jgi:hypothetical protein
MLHKDQLNNFPFEMQIPDEPYVDNFSQTYPRRFRKKNLLS